VVALRSLSEVAHHRFGGGTPGKLSFFLRERFDL
jgi:hypothetical protein